MICFVDATLMSLAADVGSCFYVAVVAIVVFCFSVFSVHKIKLVQQVA